MKNKVMYNRFMLVFKEARAWRNIGFPVAIYWLPKEQTYLLSIYPTPSAAKRWDLIYTDTPILSEKWRANI